MQNELNQEQAKEIVKAIDFRNMVFHPEPGEYVITAIQAGNLHGEKGWHLYIGYVVQVRKKAGAFGSDIVLLRHPDGSLVRHENQTYCLMNFFWREKAKKLFPEGMTPDEYEDYSKPYTLGNEYPEVGKVIEEKEDVPPRNDAPMMRITVSSENGNKSVTIV